MRLGDYVSHNIPRCDLTLRRLPALAHHQYNLECRLNTLTKTIPITTDEFNLVAGKADTLASALRALTIIGG